MASTPPVNAIVQILAVKKVKANPDRPVLGRKLLSLQVVLGDGLAGLQIDLQSPNDPFVIRRMQPPGAVRIHLPKPLQQDL